MITLALAYLFIGLLLFLGVAFLFVAMFKHEKGDGAFVMTGLILGVVCLLSAYGFARWAGL